MGYRKPRVVGIETLHPDYTFAGFTPFETRLIVIDAYLNISNVANVEFKTGQRRTRIKFRFGNNAWMKSMGKRDTIPLGLQFRWGIALNSERVINRHQAVACVMHEILHWMGLRHDTDPKSIMHWANSNVKFTDNDRRLVQRRWGKKYRQRWHTFADGYTCLMREV